MSYTLNVPVVSGGTGTVLSMGEYTIRNAEGGSPDVSVTMDCEDAGGNLMSRSGGSFRNDYGITPDATVLAAITALTEAIFAQLSTAGKID